jgi:hypothetical protein
MIITFSLFIYISVEFNSPQQAMFLLLLVFLAANAFIAAASRLFAGYPAQ